MNQLLVLFLILFSVIGAAADEAAVLTEKEKYSDLVLIMRDIRESRPGNYMRDDWLIARTGAADDQDELNAFVNNTKDSPSIVPISRDYGPDRLEDRLFEIQDSKNSK